jgi:hypothetical protein
MNNTIFHFSKSDVAEIFDKIIPIIFRVGKIHEFVVA